MGSLADAPLRTLVTALRDEYGLKTLIETGTENGVSTLVAADLFERVITIENDPEKIVQIKQMMQRWPRNIEFIAGDSVAALHNLPAETSLYWLDAHTRDSCPLLAELNAIGAGQVIVIDDARQIHWWYHWRDEPRVAWPQIPVIEQWAADHGYEMQLHDHDVIVLS